MAYKDGINFNRAVLCMGGIILLFFTDQYVLQPAKRVRDSQESLIFA